MLRFSSKLTRARSVLAIIAALTAGILIGLRATHSETIKQRPCDIYAAGNTPCVAAHSTVRSLYAKYAGVGRRKVGQAHAHGLHQVVDRAGGDALHIGLLQKGADPWQAAGYLGMSMEVLLNTYGHHHPDYLSDAVEKIAMRESDKERKAHVSGAVIRLRRNNP
jgi:hypothetical protein